MQLVRLALCVSLCLMGTSATTTEPVWDPPTLEDSMVVKIKIVDQQGNDLNLCVAGTATPTDANCGKLAAFLKSSGELRGAEIPLIGPPTQMKEMIGLSIAGATATNGQALSFQAYSKADHTLYDLSITTAQTLTAGDLDLRTFTVGQILTYQNSKSIGDFCSGNPVNCSPLVMTAIAQPTPTPTSMPTSTPTTFTQPTPTSMPTFTPTTYTQPTPTSMPTFTPTTYTQPTPTFMPTSFGLPPTPTSGTAPTYTCAAIQAAYKAQQCCTNPYGTFTLPGNRRQVSDRHTDLIEKFAMLDTLVKKGHISAQEYSIYKEKLLETLM